MRQERKYENDCTYTVFGFPTCQQIRVRTVYRFTLNRSIPLERLECENCVRIVFIASNLLLEVKYRIVRHNLLGDYIKNYSSAIKNTV